MRILVTGASGMLGSTLMEVFGAQHEIAGIDIEDVDVTLQDRVLEVISRFKPDWVLHAAAYTRVDDSERYHQEAFRVNALGSRNVAVAAYENRSAVLYYGTDYVFDGLSGAPYREFDATSPLNVYGRSKLAGEVLVRNLNPAHLVVRTSWLFGPGGPNFVDKVARRVRSGEKLRVVDDQTGSPTYTKDLAARSLEMVNRNARGVYHVTNSGQCSWLELARHVVSELGFEVPVTAISSSMLDLAARRPANSVLSNHLLELDGYGAMRSWKEAVAEHLKETS